jgi:5'-nucleotidase/UDP-sugar diphosphatase
MMRMRIEAGRARFTLLVLAVLAAAVAGSAPAAEPWNLTIFHTNDMHGAFLPEPASWRDDRAEVGGFIALAWHLARERETAAASLLVDAGDFMTGNPVCTLEADGVRGGGFVAMMNALDYDAGVIGNHEFDEGRENARRLARLARFPLLAADVLDEKDRPEFRDEPVILARGGLRIGVMGVSCASLFDVTARSRTGGLSLRGQERAVREQIARLDPVTDLLVLITHNGIEGDRDLARALAGSGLDVIVGGHSHTRLKQPEVEGGIVIVQAGSRLKNLGRLDLRVEDDRVTDFAGRLVELTAAQAEAGPELTRLVDDWRARIDAEFGREIARLETAWRRSSRGESNVGSWICDRLLERAAADVAFLNSGTLRRSLEAGAVTLGDVHELLPFANQLVTFAVSGADLRGILLQNARAAAADDRGVLQVGGVRYAWRSIGDHVEVEDATVGGRPLRDDRTYRVVAPDYVVQLADRYFGLPVPQYEEIGAGLTDTIVDAVVAARTIRSETDGRIREVGAGGR